MPSRRRSVIEMGSEFFTDPAQQPTSPGMTPLMEIPQQQQQRANTGRKQPVVNAPVIGVPPLPVRDYGPYQPPPSAVVYRTVPE